MLDKPAPSLRLRHRLGRVYKNCLGAATVISKPAPTKIHESASAINIPISPITEAL